MKYCWIVECFSILPSININWMHNKDMKRIYDIQFAWFFWYIGTDNIDKYLKSVGY